MYNCSVWTETSDININGTRVWGNKPLSPRPDLLFLHPAPLLSLYFTDDNPAAINIFSFTVTIVFPMCVLPTIPEPHMQANPPNATA